MKNPYSLTKLPSDILAETAEQHRVLRKKMGYTQAEMATRAGVSLGSLKRFEQTGEISFHSLLKLAYLLRRLGKFENVFYYDTTLDEVEKLFSNE